MPKNASKHRRKIIFHSKALEAQVNQKEAQVNQKEVNLCERPDNANLNLLTCAAYRWKAQNPNFFQSVMTFCRKMPPSCRKMRLNMCEKSFFIVMLKKPKCHKNSCSCCCSFCCCCWCYCFCCCCCCCCCCCYCCCT